MSVRYAGAWTGPRRCVVVIGTGPSVLQLDGLSSVCKLRLFGANNKSAPTVIAMSATLNIPVRSEPMPRFRKSTTYPSLTNRSIRLLNPPAKTSDSASIKGAPTAFAHSAYASSATSMAATPPRNAARRQALGIDTPKPRNAPSLWASCSRTVPARRDSACPLGRFDSASRFVV